MNIYSVLAFLMSFGVLFVGLRLSTDDLGMFLDLPSIFIVVGGTVAATAVSFQLDRLWFLTKIFFQRVIMGKKIDYRSVIIEMMKISDIYSKGESLESCISKTQDPFLKDALMLVHDDIMSEEELFILLEDRANNLYYSYSEEANKIKAVAKYPPAFGMIGTTIGMIVLLGNLGGSDALKKMGPAMAVCLITTLYGSIIANMAVMPIGENLIDSSKEIYLKNKISCEGMKLLVKKTNPVVLAEKLNTYLIPSQRLDWKKVLGK